MRLEDAIVSTLLRWAAAGRIDLPAIEQQLHWPSDSLTAACVGPALAQACERVRQRCGCLPQVTVLNDNTLGVRLLPLSAAAESALDGHYDELLDALQQALSSMADESGAHASVHSDSLPPDAQGRYPAAVPNAPASTTGPTTGGASSSLPKPAASHASRKLAGRVPTRRNRHTSG